MFLAPPACLNPRHGGRFRTHAGSHFRLGKTSVPPGFEKFIEKGKLVFHVVIFNFDFMIR
jgi:hypothetical protein